MLWWAVGEPTSVREGYFATEALGHWECVEYAVRVCPWLPVAVYRRMSDGRDDVAAVADNDKPAVWAFPRAGRLMIRIAKKIDRRSCGGRGPWPGCAR